MTFLLGVLVGVLLFLVFLWWLSQPPGQDKRDPE